MKTPRIINKFDPRPINFLNLHFWVLPLLVSLTIFFLTTRYGIGLSPDSIAYLGVAENINKGLGITVPYGLPPNQPLTQFPPLLPIFLSLISKVGISTVSSAKVLSLVLLIAFIAILYLILKLLDPQPSIFRSATLIFIAIFISTTLVFSMLWSEPLMIVLGLSGLLVFYQAQIKNDVLLTIFAGVIFALTVATRYAGITYLITALFFVFINFSISWKKRLIDWIWLTLPTISFLASWLTRKIGDDVSSTGRTLSYHPINSSKVYQLLTTFSSWFQLPENTNTILKLFISFLMFAFFLFICWGLFIAKSRQSHNIDKFFIVFVIIYSLFILTSVLFLDANIPPDTRILSPVLVVFLLFLVIAKRFDFSQATWVKSFFKILEVILPLFTIIVLMNNFALLKQSFQTGIGFNSHTWKNFESLQTINNFEGNFHLISNAPEPIYYYTHHEVYSLPKKFLSMQQDENENYNSQIQELINSEFLDTTYFVFFEDIKGGGDSDISSLQSEFKFELEKSFDEAKIYKYNPGNH